MSLVWGVVAIVGLALLSIATRGFFFISRRELPMPGWLMQGLRYAPLAALAAVIAPEVVMDHGQLLSTWKDARPWAFAAGLGWYFWRHGILGTIVSGMVVLLALRWGLGW